MPVDPVTRAQFRLALYRIEREWYLPAQQLEEAADKRTGDKLRKILRDSILSSADLFKGKTFFLSDEFSLVDASVAPILWRLPVFGIELPAQAKPIQRYMDDVFSRPSFQESLTELEQEMRQ
jgi:RNA polymerase-associated protein